MKTIEINIRRDEIDSRLTELTVYTVVKGASGNDSAAIDNVSTAGEDSSILGNYWRKAGGALAEMLKDFLTGFSIDDSSMTMTLQLSGAYDDSLTPSLMEGLRGYVTASMAAGWFRLTCEEKAPEWEEEARRLLLEAERKIYHRRRPQRACVRNT